MSEPDGNAKPVQTGLVDMGNIDFYNDPADPVPPFTIGDLTDYLNAFSEIVLNVTWAQLQPARNGPLQTTQIECAIKAVQAYNAENGTDLGIKLRVWGGFTAPDWAKSIDGAPVSVTGSGSVDKNKDNPETIGRFWTGDYINAWTSFQTTLANTVYDGMTYDDNPIIRGISNTAGASATDEPFVPLQSGQVAELQAGGYNDAAEELTLRAAVSDYATWSETPLDYTMNLFHPEDGGQETADEDFTLAVLQEAENAGRIVQVGNHALNNPLYPPDAFVYAQMAEDAVLDPSTVQGSYQTASPAVLGTNAGAGSEPGWGAYADWPNAVSQGVAADAGDIELWDFPETTGFTGLAPSQVQDLATLLAAGTPPVTGAPDDGAALGFVAPASVTGPAGAIALTGVDAVLLESAAAASTYSVTLTSTSGDDLDISDAYGIVSGSTSGSVLQFSGTLAEVNTVLASLTDILSSGIDTLRVSVSDDAGDTALRSVGVVASTAASAPVNLTASVAAMAPLAGNSDIVVGQDDLDALNIADQPGSQGTVILGATESTLSIAGSLNVGDGGTLLAMLAPSAYSTATLTIGGTLDIRSGGAARITGALSAGSVDVENGGSITADGTLTLTGTDPIVNDGTLEAVSDQTLGLQQLTLAAPVAGTGTILIDPGASLILGGASGAGESVDFAPSSVTQLSSDPYSPSSLGLEAPFGMKGTIDGFSLSDSLVLDGVTATGASYDATNATLEVSSEQGRLSFSISGDLAGLVPAVSVTGSGAEAQSTITFTAPVAGALPSVRAPTTLEGAAGAAVLVPGIVLSVPFPASAPSDTTVTVMLSAGIGKLNAGEDGYDDGDGDATIEHSQDARTLTITGTLAAVETSLQSLTYEAPAGKAAADTITVTVSDYAGASATPVTIKVFNNSAPLQFDWTAAGGGSFAEAADWTAGLSTAATPPGGTNIAAFGAGTYTVSDDGAVAEIAVTGAPTLTGQVTAQGHSGTAVDVDGGGVLTLAGGAVLTAEQAAIVGGSGAGDLTIMGGALALTGAGAAGGLVIAEDGGSTGAVTDLEQIQAAGTVAVGDSGNGTLTLLGLAASLSDGGADLGVLAGAQGTAVIDGGEWTNAGPLTVGDGGAGSLTIGGTAGGVSGQVIASDMAIGAQPGGNGSVTVAGGDLLIADADAASSTLAVGAGGTGSLAITQGGIVTAGEAEGNDGNNTGELFVGSSGSVGIEENAAFEIDGSATVDGTVAVGRSAQDSALFATALSLSIAAGGSVNLSGSNATLRATTIGIAPGGTLSGAGTISGDGGGNNTVLLADITNDGSVAAVGGNLLVYGEVAGMGALSVATGATITLQAGVASDQTLSFSPQAEAVLDDPVAFAGTIAGFGAGDTIDLASTAATGASWSAGVLTLETGSGSVALDVAGNYAANAFSVQSDGLGGTLVTFATGGGEGDVHMVTFAGVHYDFQAVGTFVAARSAETSDPLQVQIETAAANGATSVTTGFAAALADSRVTFAVDRADPVWVNGAPDMTLQTGVAQSLAGGTLMQLSPDSYRLVWATGESATVTDEDSFFNWSVSVGPGGSGESVQGLLGDNNSEGDGSLQQSDLAQTWDVTPSDSLFDDIPSGASAPSDFTHSPAAAPAPPPTQIPAQTMAMKSSAVPASVGSPWALASSANQRFLSADDVIGGAVPSGSTAAASPDAVKLQTMLRLDQRDLLASFSSASLYGLPRLGKPSGLRGNFFENEIPFHHHSAALKELGTGLSDGHLDESFGGIPGRQDSVPISHVGENPW